MGLFDFFRKRKVTDKAAPPTDDNEDRSQWTGKDFEFLITGDVDIPAADYDRIMTPNTFQWKKVNRDDWYYYQVGEDEFERFPQLVTFKTKSFQLMTSAFRNSYDGDFEP